MSSRVARRLGSRLWDQRGALIGGAVVIAAITGYMMWNSGSLPSSQAAAAAGGGDCADTTMLAIASKSADSARTAYDCMDPAFKQRVAESEFVRQVQSSGAGSGQVARVGDYNLSNGSKIVYYALDGGREAVAYAIYLAPDGKVQRID